MKLDLVGYFLGLLDSDDRRRTEVALRNDAAATRRLDQLRTTLAPLDTLRDDVTLPPGLAERTVAYVLTHTAAPTPGDCPTPARRLVAPDDRPAFQSSRWRRADAAVAACILVVLGGLGFAGLGRLQQHRDIATCQNNMRDLYFALADFSDRHQGHFPQVQDQPPHNVAGAFVPLLRESGSLPPAGAPECPAIALVSSGSQPPAGYAYTLGYRDEAGRLHGLSSDTLPEGKDFLPIMADRMKPVSHGTGHNVLYIGGNVRFCTSSNVGINGDDIFLNQAARIAAGLHRLDTVLGSRDSYP